jgi:lycopene cyclase domain-containing protein
MERSEVIQSFTWTYLAALLFSLGGLALLDWRFKLAFFREPKRALSVVGFSLIGFITLDYLALAFGSFVAGTSQFETGIFLPGQLPIEEPLFLLLLVYSALLLGESFGRWRQK